MPGRESQIREVAVPAVALGALRQALRREHGPLTAIHTLHSTGFETGDALFEAFDRTLRTSLEETGEEAFWTSLGRFLSRRGWGTVEHGKPHPGVGLLSSPDWAESEGQKEGQPVCAFSVGLLSRLLTRVADEPVAVLETSCRARDDGQCQFAFGSEATIHELYGLLLEGRSLEQALAEL